MAAGALVVGWLWRTGPAPQVGTANTPGEATPVADPRTRSALAAVKPAQPGTQLPADDPYAENPLGDVMHRVVDNDDQLRKFKAFYDRPLLDAESRKQYQAMLSDPATLAAVERDLLYPEDVVADQASSIKRLMKIDYLHEAMDWKENPQHDLVVRVVTETIVTDNFPADMGMDMRASLSGNKQELFQLLDEYEPAKAQAALQAAKGTRLEAMMTWIAQSNEKRKQLEANLDNQVTP
ncbi:MAG TPA: hypothetical protein VHW23_19840 [Kofleriaceae bacterium]|nr:hypothetical protein [Kofleriaceae bacterium]